MKKKMASQAGDEFCFQLLKDLLGKFLLNPVILFGIPFPPSFLMMIRRIDQDFYMVLIRRSQ